MSKDKSPICKRTDKGVVALWFDNQEGNYFSDTFPSTLDYYKAAQLEDRSPRYELIAYIEVGNQTDRGFPLPGKQVH